MTKRRIGTIQSFRPGYGAVMPEKASYGKLFAAFKVFPENLAGDSGPGSGFGAKCGRKMAGAAGLEPATCGFGDRRSTN